MTRPIVKNCNACKIHKSGMIECEVLGKVMSVRMVELCHTRSDYKRLWSDKTKKHQRSPKQSKKAKNTYTYATEEERASLIEKMIKETCRGCSKHIGTVFSEKLGSEDVDLQKKLEGFCVDVCDCFGCRKMSRKNIRDINECPLRRWALIEFQEEQKTSL